MGRNGKTVTRGAETGTSTPGPSGVQEVEDLEVDLLLEGIWRRYGVDLREYDHRFIRERVRGRLRHEGLTTATQLLERVLREPAALDALLDAGEDAAGAFFRPARAWKALRRKAIPFLRTYPSVRGWAAGVSSGGDLYSLLIVMTEELTRDFTLYATDPSDRRLRAASAGSFRRSQLRLLARSYADAGGRKSMTDYLEPGDGDASLLPSLRKRIVFASHNLATDASFNEFHLILARSTLKRFNEPLRARGLRLIHDSLVRFGFLMLGAGESLDGTGLEKSYRSVDRGAGLFQKVAE